MAEYVEHEYTDEVVCPYCGREMSDSWELDGLDGEERIIECDWCCKEMRYVRHVLISYSTYRMEQ